MVLQLSGVMTATATITPTTAGIDVALDYSKGAMLHDGNVFGLDVYDDGCGFDAARVATGRRAGLGLASMRERMDHLHGRLELRSQPGKGSRLTVTCPLEILDARAAG